MQTMNISLPDQLRDFVDVRDLIRDDEKHKSKEKLEALLVEGIQSGGATGMTHRDWSDIRAEALKHFEARKVRKSA